MRFALSIEYIGEKYYGWQKQNSDSTNTVQYFVDKAISKVANHEVKTICSGRTDTGVNALNQIIHFDSDSSRSEKNWIDGINSNLPNDIRLKSILKVNEEFHARFSQNLGHISILLTMTVKALFLIMRTHGLSMRNYQ